MVTYGGDWSMEEMQSPVLTTGLLLYYHQKKKKKNRKGGGKEVDQGEGWRARPA